MTQLKNFTNKGFAIAYRTVVLLMGLQIVLGLAWLVANLTGVQDFAETKELLEISNTWVLDEYVGIGYPVCVWIARIPASVTGVSYALFLYVLQLLAAFFSSRYFLKKSGLAKGKMLWFGAAYLMTIPMVAQFHAAVLPYSFASSVFMVLLGEGIALCKQETDEKMSIWILGMCWLAGALLLPEYLWIMGLVVAVICGLWLRVGKKGYWYAGILLLSVVLVSCVTTELTSEPGSRGRMEKSVSATLLKRVVWPNIDKNSYFWSDKVTDLFEMEELLEISHEPENVLYIFGPQMEKAYGKELAEKEYLQMAGVSLKMRTKEVLAEAARDFLCYGFPHGAVLAQFQGDGVSYSGWNYSRMGEETPNLTKYYVNLSLVGFMFQLVLVVAMIVCQKAGKGFAKERPCTVPVVFVFAVILPAVWYTMEGAGIWNYNNVLVTFMLWAAFLVKGISGEELQAYEE